MEHKHDAETIETEVRVLLAEIISTIENKCPSLVNTNLGIIYQHGKLSITLLDELRNKVAAENDIEPVIEDNVEPETEVELETENDSQDLTDS